MQIIKLKIVLHVIFFSFDKKFPDFNNKSSYMSCIFLKKLPKNRLHHDIICDISVSLLWEWSS
jgi:hypothetical protein